MQTKQQHTIKAIEELISVRYTNHQALACPLCVIHRQVKSVYFNSKIKSNCKGCPNNIGQLIINIKSTPCKNFSTFMLWLKEPSFRSAQESKSIPRREFWTKALPILEKLPSKAFTKTGYKHKYFEFLIDLDKSIKTT